MQKKNRNNLSILLKKCLLSFISMMIVVTGFSMAATTAYADELNEIYTSVDALIEVKVTRTLEDDKLIIDLIANTRADSNIVTMSHDDTILESDENIYVFSTTEDGSYRFIVEYTSEEYSEVKIMIFTLDINEFELRELKEQEVTKPAAVEVVEEIDEPTENVTAEESNEIQSSNDDNRILDRIPSSDELDSLLKENEYVLIDNETGLITIETHTFETQARALKASNVVTTGRKVTQGTVRVEWKADRSYYWTLWSGVSELFVDGQIAYCLEPAIMDSVATTGANGTAISDLGLVRVHPDGRLAFKLSYEQKLNLELIANYGDKYPGHQTDAYIWATKILIWESLGWDVSQRGSLNPQAEIAEINRLIANHTDQPAWHNELRKGKVGEEITLTDPTLSTFSVNTNITTGLTIISKIGNSITFRIDAKAATLGLSKIGGSAEGTSYIYSDGESQKAGVFNIKDPMRSGIRYEQPQGNLEIIKKNNFNELMPGVIYEFSKNANMSAPFKTITTDTSGKIVLNDIDADEVIYYREKSTIVGHILDNTIYNTKIIAGETIKNARTNTAIVGSSKLHKTGDGGTKLLEGVLFGLFKVDGTKLSEQRTNASGEITADGLRYGAYYWQELEALPGYWLDDTKHHFNIGDNDHGAVIDVAAVNKRIQAKVLVRKIDSETLEPLEGVGFKILDANNEVVTIKFQEGKHVVEKSEWFTDADGEFLLEATLDAGTYKLIESFTLEGYNPIEPISFVIDENQNYINLEIIGTVLDLGNIENTKIYGDVLIKKIDAKTGLPISGVTFDIYNAKMEMVTSVVTDANGEALLQHIVYGQYHAFEVNVPAPYVINPDKAMQSFFVSEEGKVYELMFENERAVGEIEITKRDAKTDEVIAGVEYGLYDVTDLLVDESTVLTYDEIKALNAIETLTTDETGVVVFKHLDLSRTYAVIEHNAPYGYVVSTEVQLISLKYIDQDTPIVCLELTLLNERLKVIIHGEKRDIQTKELIPTADFVLELKDSQGNIIEPILFKDGVFTWEVDALEIYTLSESKAPEGYLLSDEIIEISTFEAVDGNTYIIEYFNELMPVIMLPSTGIASNGLTLAFLVLVLGIILLLVNNAITESVLEIRKTNVLIVNKEFRTSVNHKDIKKEVVLPLGHYQIKWKVSFRNYHEHPART